MRVQNFVSLYHNSGAFGFVPDVTTHIRGWIGPDDPTLRESVRTFMKQIPEPHVTNLVSMLSSIWREHLPGRAWVMPMSHWSYELDFGSREWLGAALAQIGIDSQLLITRNNGAAIEFQRDEVVPFERFTCDLLTNLTASDFAMVFPDHPVLVTLHHHRQLWWVTGDSELSEKLDAATK